MDPSENIILGWHEWMAGMSTAEKKWLIIQRSKNELEKYLFSVYWLKKVILNINISAFMCAYEKRNESSVIDEVVFDKILRESMKDTKIKMIMTTTTTIGFCSVCVWKREYYCRNAIKDRKERLSLEKADNKMQNNFNENEKWFCKRMEKAKQKVSPMIKLFGMKFK